MRALVLGVNGQDGSYMAEHLLLRGYEVTGVGRQDSSRYVQAEPDFHYCKLDIANADALTELMKTFEPDEIYHLAAIHGPNAPSYEPVWREMMAVNTLSLHTVLEYARPRAEAVRVAYANSTKIFGRLDIPVRVDEHSRRDGKCLYSITKNAAYDLIDHYRHTYSICVLDMILSNHDSPRRPSGFFLPDLVACLADALRDPSTMRTFKSLDFWIDSGDASEFMDIARILVKNRIGGNLVFATGNTWLGRDLVQQLFSSHGLDYRKHLVTETVQHDPGTGFHFDISRLHAAFCVTHEGDQPKRTLLDVAETMLAEKLKERAL